MRPALLLLALFAGNSAIAAPEERGMNDREMAREIYYTKDLPCLSGTLAAVIVDPGKSGATLTFNDGPRQEIGDYEATLPGEAFENARALLAQSNYRHLVRSKGVVPPGRHYVCLGERAATEKLPVIQCFWVHEVPPEVGPVIQQIEVLVDRIRQHPIRALRGEARWEKSPMEAGNDLSISVALKNVGIEPFEIDNPLESERAFMLHIARETATPGQEKEDWAELKPSNVRWAPPSKQPKQPKPTGPSGVLQPGESWELLLKKKAYLEPGRFKADLRLRLSDRAEGKPAHPHGELRMDLGTLTVTKTRGLWPPWK